MHFGIKNLFDRVRGFFSRRARSYEQAEVRRHVVFDQHATAGGRYRVEDRQPRYSLRGRSGRNTPASFVRPSPPTSADGTGTDENEENDTQVDEGRVAFYASLLVHLRPRPRKEGHELQQAHTETPQSISDEGQQAPMINVEINAGPQLTGIEIPVLGSIEEDLAEANHEGTPSDQVQQTLADSAEVIHEGTPSDQVQQTLADPPSSSRWSSSSCYSSVKPMSETENDAGTFEDIQTANGVASSSITGYPVEQSSEPPVRNEDDTRRYGVIFDDNVAWWDWAVQPY